MCLWKSNSELCLCFRNEQQLIICSESEKIINNAGGRSIPANHTQFPDAVVVGDRREGEEEKEEREVELVGQMWLQLPSLYFLHEIAPQLHSMS